MSANCPVKSRDHFRAADRAIIYLKLKGECRMLHPSYTDLINVVNSDIEPGEQPVVQSRYSIVIAASKRARQLIGGEEPLGPGTAGKKPLSIAIDELYHQQVKILPEEETTEEEEADAKEAAQNE